MKVKTKEKNDKGAIAPVTIRIAAGLAQELISSPVMGQVLKKEFPVKTSYWLSRILRRLQSEMVDFNQQRHALLEKYGAKDEKGQFIIVAGQVQLGENAQVFAQAYSELAEIEIDVGFHPLVLDMERCPDLTTEEMLWLAPLLAEEAEGE